MLSVKLIKYVDGYPLTGIVGTTSVIPELGLKFLLLVNDEKYELVEGITKVKFDKVRKVFDFETVDFFYRLEILNENLTSKDILAYSKRVSGGRIH